MDCLQGRVGGFWRAMTFTGSKEKPIRFGDLGYWEPLVDTHTHTHRQRPKAYRKRETWHVKQLAQSRVPPKQDLPKEMDQIGALQGFGILFEQPISLKLLTSGGLWKRKAPPRSQVAGGGAADGGSRCEPHVLSLSNATLCEPGKIDIKATRRIKREGKIAVTKDPRWFRNPGVGQETPEDRSHIAHLGKLDAFIFEAFVSSVTAGQRIETVWSRDGRGMYWENLPAFAIGKRAQRGRRLLAACFIMRSVPSLSCQLLIPDAALDKNPRTVKKDWRLILMVWSHTHGILLYQHLKTSKALSLPVVVWPLDSSLVPSRGCWWEVFGRARRLDKPWGFDHPAWGEQNMSPPTAGSVSLFRVSSLIDFDLAAFVAVETQVVPKKPVGYVWHLETRPSWQNETLFPKPTSGFHHFQFFCFASLEVFQKPFQTSFAFAFRATKSLCSQAELKKFLECFGPVKQMSFTGDRLETPKRSGCGGKREAQRRRRSFCSKTSWFVWTSWDKDFFFQKGFHFLL